MRSFEREAVAAWREMPRQRRDEVEARARAGGTCPSIGRGWALYAFGLFFAGQVVGAWLINLPLLFAVSPLIVGGLGWWHGTKEGAAHELRLAMMAQEASEQTAFDQPGD